MGMNTAASLPSISAHRCSSLSTVPPRAKLSGAIPTAPSKACNRRISLLGCLGFAVTSEDHRHIRIRQLWLRVQQGMTWETDRRRGRHAGIPSRGGPVTCAVGVSRLTERTQFWSHLLAKEADGIEHAIQRDASPDVRLHDHARQAKLVP